MSPAPGGLRAGNHGFPRASGDEPYADETVYDLSEFSPRERG